MEMERILLYIKKKQKKKNFFLKIRQLLKLIGNWNPKCLFKKSDIFTWMLKVGRIQKIPDPIGSIPQRYTLSGDKVHNLNFLNF